MNNINKDKLNTEELNILESFKNDEWESVPNLNKRKEEIKSYARANLRKDKRVNIRMTERDLRELQRQASQEGLPYQTFISSILHKFINGNIVDRKVIL